MATKQAAGKEEEWNYHGWTAQKGSRVKQEKK